MSSLSQEISFSQDCSKIVHKHIKVCCSCLFFFFFFFFFIPLIFARYFQDISTSTHIFQKKSLTFPEIFSSISLKFSVPFPISDDSQ